MTLFKTLMAGLVLTLSGTSSALPCEIALGKLPGQVAPRSSSAVAHKPVEFADLVSENIYFPVPGKEGTFWTVVFDPDVKDKNQGHYVVGSWDEDEFVAESAEIATRNAQRDYFHLISETYQLKEKFFTINSKQFKGKQFKGKQFKVQPWVEVKLWLKHNLRLEDVKSAIEKNKGPCVYETVNGELRRNLYGPAANGRLIKVVFVEDQTGSGLPHTVITAFEEAAKNDSSKVH